MLASFTLLNTRPAHQAQALSELVTTQGGLALACPSIEIVPLQRPILEEPAEDMPLSFDYQALLNVDHMVFVSVNAVAAFVDLMTRYVPNYLAQFQQKKGPLVYGIGEASDKALQNAGLTTQSPLRSQFDSESLLASEAFQNLCDAKVHIFKGLGGRDKLAAELKVRGAKVMAWSLYERQPAVWCREVWQTFLAAPEPMLLFTSIFSFETFLENLKSQQSSKDLNQAMQLETIVFSHRIRDFLRQSGWLGRIEVVPIQSDLGILQAIDHLRELRLQ